MLPNYLAVPALVLNVAVFTFLRKDIAIYIKGVRGLRQIHAFRVAGLLLLLVAVSQAQTNQPKTVVGVAHDGDWVIAQQMYAEKGIDYNGVDWTNFMDFPNLARYAMWVWEHSGNLLAVAFLLFLVLHFGSGREENETDIHKLNDADYATAFVSDYHGDDAFEVPDGMHSEHKPVPVRGRSAAAGR